MDPAACDQVIRKTARTVGEGISLPILGVSPEETAGDIHFPELLGRLAKGGLEPADLLLLTLLGFLELGDVRRGDQHHRHHVVVFDLRRADMPPEPRLAVSRADPVGVLHLGVLADAPCAGRSGEEGSRRGGSDRPAAWAAERTPVCFR